MSPRYAGHGQIASIGIQWFSGDSLTGLKGKVEVRKLKICYFDRRGRK